MKGLSPLVATALLIAITISVAIVLANFVSQYTSQTLTNLPTCVGGSVNFATGDYPKWDAPSNSIVSLVEAQYTDLGSFRTELLLNNDTTVRYSNVNPVAIPAGSTGRVSTGSLNATVQSQVKQVRVISNCSNVRTEWTNLK